LYYDIASVKENADTMVRLYFLTPYQTQKLFFNETSAPAHFSRNIFCENANHHFNLANTMPITSMV